MQPEEKAVIRRWSEASNPSASLALETTGDPRSEKLAQFCEQLTLLAPGIEIRKIRRDTEDPPAIAICDNLRYHGVPAANELPPFLEMVGAISDGAAPPSPSEAGLAGLDLPAELELYVSPQCAHCPAMVGRTWPVARASRLVRLSIFDAGLFAQRAADAGIRSVPTLVLDGAFRWTGKVPIADVSRMILSRNPADLSESALLSFLAEGNADRIVELMKSHQTVFPALIDLVTHEKWPRRLGAMVAMESLAEEDPPLAARAAPELVKRLDRLADDVKGDVVYVLGEIGGPELTPVLRRIAAEGSPELAESAAEALERIGEK